VVDGDAAMIDVLLVLLVIFMAAPVSGR